MSLSQLRLVRLVSACTGESQVWLGGDSPETFHRGCLMPQDRLHMGAQGVEDPVRGAIGKAGWRGLGAGQEQRGWKTSSF